MRRRGRRRPLKKRPGCPADIAGRPSFLVSVQPRQQPETLRAEVARVVRARRAEKRTAVPADEHPRQIFRLAAARAALFFPFHIMPPEMSMAEKGAFYAQQKPLRYAISRYDLVRDIFSGVYGAFTGVIRGLLRLNFQKRAKSLCFSGVLWYNNSVKMNLCASI